MNNEEQYNEIREKLRKLPRMKVRDGFENELLRRINLLDTDTAKAPVSKSSFWGSLFGKRSLAWTVPVTSLAVIAIVFVGVYFAFYKSKDMQNASLIKQSAIEQSSIESLKTFSDSKGNTKNEIPGKDIANDLEISKSPAVERKSELDKGLNETYFDQSPKPVAPLKTNVIDSKKETTIYEKAEDVGKTGKSIKQADEKEVGNMNNGVLKEEKKVEESLRSKDTEIKKSSPLIQDVDKIKSEKTDKQAKDKIESKSNEDAKIKEDARKKEETRIKEEAKRKEEIRVKEEAKRKEETRIKEEAKRKEEARKKEEAKRKEDTKKKEELEKLKEKINDN